MQRKTRSILFSGLVILYLIISPFLIFYALGYRFDLKKKEVLTTGGFYLKIWPEQTEIYADNKLEKKTGLFSNEILLQGLDLRKYSFSVQKDGYFSWQKTLEIKKQEVTRMENVTLIKKQIPFEKIGENIKYASLSPDYSRVFLTKIINNKNNFVVLDAASWKQLGSVDFAESIDYSNLKTVWSNDLERILISAGTNNLIFDYKKTKEESLTLLQKNINYSGAFFNPEDSREIFFANNNKIYILRNEKKEPVLENLITYLVSNNQIFWLDESGFVNRSNLIGQKIETLNKEPISVKSGDYKIVLINGYTFLQENKNLFLLNIETKNFENFYSPINDLKISPDKSKIVYFNDNQVFYSDAKLLSNKIIIYNSPKKIIDCFWLNSNYLIFNINGKIKISEIDTRDKINIAELPSKIFLADNTYFDSKTPQVFWDEVNKKLYLFENKEFLASEPLTDRNNP